LKIVFPAWAPDWERMLEALPLMAAQGVEWVELGLESASFFHENKPEEVERVQETLAEHGLRVNSIHTPFGDAVDLSSRDEEAVKNGLAVHRQAMALAQRLAVPCLVVHAGDGAVTEKRNQRRERAYASLCELAPLAEEANVMLAVENLPKKYLGARPEELLGLIDRVGSSHVAICFDSGHAHLHGRVLEFARALLPRTVTTHLHDNYGQNDDHLFPGFGTIPWAELAAIYKEIGCTAPLMLECAPPEGWDWRWCAGVFGRVWEGGG